MLLINLLEFFKLEQGFLKLISTTTALCLPSEQRIARLNLGNRINVFVPDLSCPSLRE